MKKNKYVSWFIFAALSLCMAMHCLGQPAAQWQQDINILVSKIKQYHPMPWAKISQKDFINKAEEIKAGLKGWPKERIILELMKLVASLRDGHTGILLNNRDGFNRWFPVRFEKFHEGIFITAASEENAALLGARVLSLGNLDAESAYKRTGTIITADSEHGIARLSTSYLPNAIILHTLGIINNQRLLPLEVLLGNGTKMKVSLKSARWRAQFNLNYFMTRAPTNQKVKTIFEDKLDSLPLYLSGMIPARVPYWFKYLPQKKILYFQYNNVTNWRREPFRDFSKRLFKTYDQHITDIEKFVIDLRFNSGGNGYLLPPFVQEFVLRKNSLTRGKLIIITGIHTFSAASNFIGKMLKNTSALTVGDIAPGPLNWCSDIITFALPNSNLRVNISTMYWQEGHPTDTRGYYPPDFYLPLTFKDYISGTDPALAAISSNQVSSLKDILFNQGVDPFRSERQWREKMYGPAKIWFPYTSFDLTIYTIMTLNPAGKTEEAREITRLNTKLYPEKMRAWYFQAEMLTNSGKLKKALECYKKVTAIEPHIPEVQNNHNSLMMRIALQDKGIQGVAKLFARLKKKYPNQINEGILNNLGYLLMRQKKFRQAIEVFKLNVEIYTDYANGYDSLAEAYMNAGENDKAIKNYQKSLELDPANNNARQMLKRLKMK